MSIDSQTMEAVIVELTNFGAEGAALAAAVGRIMAASKKVRSSGAERQARFRAKRATENAARNADVTLHNVIPLVPSLPPTPPISTINPHTPSPPKGGSVPRKTAFRRAPSDWKPGVDDLTTGTDLGLTMAEIGRELEKFRDHEFAKPKTDWSATFRNWLRETASRLGRGADDLPLLNGAPRNARHHSSKLDARNANMARAYFGFEAAAGPDPDGGGGCDPRDRFVTLPAG